MREVETSLGAMLDTGEDGRKTENAAIASIILAQVSAMAQDTGMTPMEVWQAHGIKAVLSEADVKRNEDGTLTAVSEKAKKVLAEGRSLDETHEGRVHPLEERHHPLGERRSIHAPPRDGALVLADAHGIGGRS